MMLLTLTPSPGREREAGRYALRASLFTRGEGELEEGSIELGRRGRAVAQSAVKYDLALLAAGIVHDDALKAASSNTSRCA